MMVGRITFSLLARTFEAILDMTLERLIGQYSGIFLGLLTLGMRIICVSLNFGGEAKATL